MILEGNVRPAPGYTHSDGRTVLCVDIALPKADTALGLLPDILPHEELALNFQSHNQKHLFAISLPLLRFAR